jgi:hypothetical protein
MERKRFTSWVHDETGRRVVPAAPPDLREFGKLRRSEDPDKARRIINSFLDSFPGGILGTVEESAGGEIDSGPTGALTEAQQELL